MKKDVISLFPYVGGKSSLALNLVEIVYYAYAKYPNLTTFVDACGGGGRLILNLPRRGRQIYSELDPNLCNLFWAVSSRSRVIDLISRLESNEMSVSKENYIRFYKRYTEWSDNPALIAEPMESAAYAYYLTHLSYNGRLKSPGFYTTKFKNGMSIRNEEENQLTEAAYWNSISRLPDFPDILQGVEFYTGNCLYFLTDPEFNNESTLIYLDPPYLKDMYVRESVLKETALYLEDEDAAMNRAKLQNEGKDPLPFNYINIADRFDKIVRHNKQCLQAFDISLRTDYLSGAPLRLHMDIVYYALKSPAKIIISGYDNSIYRRLLEVSDKWRKIKMGEQAVVSSRKEQKAIETEYLWLNF